MLTRFAILQLLVAFGFSFLLNRAQAANPTPPAKASPATPATGAQATKPVVDQNAQVIIFGYHRFVDKLRHPDTEITPQDFEKQMQMLKDKGITVIGMQDFLAWRRGEKSIPPRAAVISFDDGWKSQYEVAWPIMKKFGYTFTMFIYTEGVRGGKFGGGEAMTWEQLADMRDAGIDIEGHTATHQDLRRPFDKVAKKRLSPPEYEEWLQNEIVGSKQLLEQRLGIKVNCFAVPYGFYNQHIKDIARNAGFEAIFTTYGQPITFRASLDSLGRTFAWGNKPKMFTDAVASIATSSSGGAPVAEVGAASLQTQPADGETVRTAMPLIRANLSAFGQVDPGSVKMRVSGLGIVPSSFDATAQTVSYQVTQKLRDKTCSVIIEAMSGGKKVEAHWTFGVPDAGAAVPAASAAATPKK